MNSTLIIGLGGAGSKVTTKIYQKFLASNPSDEDRKKLVCLCFDTDLHEIWRNKEKLPSGWVVRISPDHPLDAVYEKMKAVSTVQDWFDSSAIPCMSHTLHDGSAMSRMAARLAFLDAEAEGKLMVIDNSIERLYALDTNINIHIICSLAGGTGSGIFYKQPSISRR